MKHMASAVRTTIVRDINRGMYLYINVYKQSCTLPKFRFPGIVSRQIGLPYRNRSDCRCVVENISVRPPNITETVQNAIPVLKRRFFFLRAPRATIAVIMYVRTNEMITKNVRDVYVTVESGYVNKRCTLSKTCSKYLDDSRCTKTWIQRNQEQ